ncbi:hypothetical protein ANCDUO_19155, partial [Ancylostoma duodenale]
WKLSLIWFAGFLFRYLILVPIRIALFVLGMSIMVCACYLMGHVSNKRENRAKKGGICVANHTSPIDVMVLSCDNCYAMVGQKQGGILGFIEESLSRAEDHIWFERSEAGDRKK